MSYEVPSGFSPGSITGTGDLDLFDLENNFSGNFSHGNLLSSNLLNDSYNGGNSVTMVDGGENQAAGDSSNNNDLFDLDFFQNVSGDDDFKMLIQVPPILEPGAGEVAGSSACISTASTNVRKEENTNISDVSPGGSTVSKPCKKTSGKKGRKHKDLTPEKKKKENDRVRAWRYKEKEEKKRLKGRVRELEEQEKKLLIERKDLADQLLMAQSDKCYLQRKLEAQENSNSFLEGQLLHEREINRRLRAEMSQCLFCSHDCPAAL